MNSELKQAAQQALKALNNAVPEDTKQAREQFDAIQALRTALQQATQAEVTDAAIDAATRHIYHNGRPTSKEYRVGIARAILAMRPVQVNALAGCNCRWDGDNQVEWCELHLAHKEAIHEWAERAKSAEQKLALRPVQVPMTEDQVWHNNALMSANGIAGFKMDALMRIVRAVEAHRGIKPKEQA